MPYTSESKEAIKPYPEILKEIKLGLQQCARRLAQYLHHEAPASPGVRSSYLYRENLPHIGIALQEILALSDSERDSVVGRLDDALHKSRAMSGAEP